MQLSNLSDEFAPAETGSERALALIDNFSAAGAAILRSSSLLYLEEFDVS